MHASDPRALIDHAATVATPRKHDSARKHVTGEAIYVDDLREPAGCLQVHVTFARAASARIRTIDLTPCRGMPGVLAALDASAVPGRNDISPTHRNDEPILADGSVQFFGQPLFVTAAETIEQARLAADRAIVELAEEEPVLNLDEAARRGEMVTEGMTLQRGDPVAAMASAQHTLSGSIEIGGQDHFYLEGQVSLAIPSEDGDMLVYCSTQHPSEVQQMVATVLDLPLHSVTVEVRRMGGGFGGKETQAATFACLAALVARHTSRPAKCRLDRDDDMIMTGKRHDFRVDYKVGFSDNGEIHAVLMEFLARCGFSSDLSGPVTDRALFHADNCYAFNNVRLQSYPLKTNTVSNTAFRGFGGPQGMVAAERIIEEVAFATGLDPLDVRKRNFYKSGSTTPYHQVIEEETGRKLVETLEARSNYRERRLAIQEFNATSRWIKKGLSLTPVKFGISFTLTSYNQAGALVHIYRDGSVLLNHGGTEMGQGLFIKVAQIVADELGIPLDQVKITATNTGKVPNTSATAASSGSDLNGMAARNAARTLKRRLVELAARLYQCRDEEVTWRRGEIAVGDQTMSFRDLVSKAYHDRVQLSATGFYKTPKIHWDRSAGRGRPFYYFAYGAAVSEVTVDTLTGEYRVDRADILHDVGRSLNPAVDLGQIEGGFIQGMGWLTTEELWWDAAGALRTHSPSTYKIPTAGDRPALFTIDLWDEPNKEETIYRSKAVGEPPFMLAISVLHALSDAVAATAGHSCCPRLDTPATPERILMAIQRLQRDHEEAQG